jgi:hypothetical protein
LKTTRTDKSGHFSLTGIEDGVYTVRAELEGYFALANAGTFFTGSFKNDKQSIVPPKT